MSRDSGSGDPSQRTVAELLAEHGGGGSNGSRRRRRRAEDPSETAPQAIIDRVNSDSGRMRPVTDEAAAQGAPPSRPPESPEAQQTAPPAGQAPAPQPQQAPPAQPQQAPPAPEQVNSPAGSRGSRGARSRSAPQAPPESQAANGGEAVGADPAAEGAQPGTSDQQSRNGGKFGPWARRLGPGSAESRKPKLRRPGGKAPAEQDATAGPESDTEITAQQAPVAEPGNGSASPPAEPAPDRRRRDTGAGRQPGSPAAWAARQSPQADKVDGATEQFPPVTNASAAAVPARTETTDGDGTALLGYAEPAEEGSDGTNSGTADPYSSGYYDPYELDPYADDAGDPYADDLYDAEQRSPAFAEDADRGDWGGTDEDEDAEELRAPAGMSVDDLDEDVDEEEPRSTAQEWLMLAAQITGGLLGGGAVWVGFRWLWTALPIAALVAALIVTAALVLIARKFLRSDDLQTILLSVLVGLMCTVSPVVLLLVGY